MKKNASDVTNVTIAMEDFRRLLDLAMIMDPRPEGCDEAMDEAFTGLLDRAARNCGYATWTVAYHELEIDPTP